PEERALGYVPQGLGLFPHRTVERNVRYPMELRDRKDADSRTRDLLERFRLTPLRGRYPTRLSGGEKQRVALARALAADPELIVWDEPWQALDVMARHELGLILHEVRETERVPIVVVTHDAALAFSIADTFLVLHRGRVQTSCDAETLLRSPSDPFVARFVGFENVYDRATLEAALPSPFAAWLLNASGDGGVAFMSPVLSAEPEGPGTWEGTVRSVRPTPRGLSLEVRADGLFVNLSVPVPVPQPPPTIGQRRRFAVDPNTLHTLENSSHGVPEDA
ncbi:MAG: ATP-binding cassette domain-containing protein, partial [Thermoplasmata archaeon]